jgi:hypothetical protein
LFKFKIIQIWNPFKLENCSNLKIVQFQKSIQKSINENKKMKKKTEKIETKKTG